MHSSCEIHVNEDTECASCIVPILDCSGHQCGTDHINRQPTLGLFFFCYSADVTFLNVDIKNMKMFSVVVHVRYERHSKKYITRVICDTYFYY